MTALLLEPHNDDAALFAAYVCCKYRPLIVTVLRSHNQAPAITHQEREGESARAAAELGCEWRQWAHLDSAPNWAAIRDDLVVLEAAKFPQRVFAPWPEPGGHADHNRLGELAREVFGDRVSFYATYRLGGPRSTAGEPVEPERAWVLAKLRALACYESQILRGPVRFFTHPLEERLVM